MLLTNHFFKEREIREEDLYMLKISINSFKA